MHAVSSERTLATATREPITCQCGHTGFQCRENDAPFSALWEADDELAFKQDAAHLLFDEARVLDGDRPADARMFCDRLARILTRSLGKSTA